jgi:ribose 5-phosphate isomerase B
MKIAIACDHGALDLKNKLVSHLGQKGHEVKDFGTYTTASCDYPDFAAAAARAVACGEYEKGIVLCTTGIGVSIVANKVKGIRCALLSDVMSARLTREHNDTNMMAMGAGVIGQMLALEIVDTWLGTEFSHNERHQRRIDKLMAIEE